MSRTVALGMAVVLVCGACERRATQPPPAAGPPQPVQHIQPDLPTRAAKPPNPAVRTPMMPSYRVPDRNRNTIEVPSQIHDVQIKAVLEDDGRTLVLTFTNHGAAIEVERAGLIYMASLLPQDPPQLWETFARELRLPLRLDARQQVSARVSRDDVRAYGARGLYAKSRDGSDILPAGVSLIDGDDAMHWYAVEGVREFIEECLKEDGLE